MEYRFKAVIPPTGGDDRFVELIVNAPNVSAAIFG